MNAITHREESASLVTADASAILAVIERAARDPAVDIEKMERLMAMAERMAERQAKADYNAALAEMQPNLPIVERRGMISVPAKDNKTGHDTPYALWEDVNEAIRPMLAEHGFALSFRVGKDSDRVVVTGVLSHRGGHSEETTLSLPMDTTGSKNNVQAIGSSVSYGKRYTAGALLNLTSRGEDDDGQSGGDRAGSAAFQKAVEVVNGWESATELQEWKKAHAPGLRDLLPAEEWKSSSPSSTVEAKRSKAAWPNDPDPHLRTALGGVDGPARRHGDGFGVFDHPRDRPQRRRKQGPPDLPLQARLRDHHRRASRRAIPTPSPTAGSRWSRKPGSLYAFDHDVEPALVGFVTNGRKGCSPDALVGDNGLLEIKTKAAHLHIECLLNGEFPPEHKAQCQGALLVCEREWIDLVIYWPKLPLITRRAYRDEPYLKDLSAAIDTFNGELDALVAKVRAYGMERAA